MIQTEIQTEKRCYSGQEFRAVESDNEKFIEGHAAVFEQKTDICGCFFEVIARGAFDNCDLSDVLLLVNHNFEQLPLARSRSNNSSSSMTLTVDDVGLAIRAKLNVEGSQNAKELYTAVERGDIGGMSFCFRVTDEEWQNLDSDMPTRCIKSIGRVYEVSAVNWPLYEGTDINARAADDALECAKKTLAEARRGKSLSNDKANEVEIYRLKNQILGGI